MAKNLNSTQAGTYQSNDVNTPSVVVHKGKNQFPQSFLHPSTASYGLVDPVGVAKCEPGDIYPYKFVTDLNTFTMSSPLKSKVNMYSAAFKVPMKAIYPRNWDIMYPIPNKGSDVPEDTRAIFDFNTFFDSYNFEVLNSHITSVVNDGEVDTSYLNFVVRTMFLCESVFSDGSLFSKLNMHFCSYDFSNRAEWSEGQRRCFDDLFDLDFIPWLKSVCYVDDLPDNPNTVEISELIIAGPNNIQYGNSFRLSPNINKIGVENYISFERMIELLRSGDFVFTRVDRSSNNVPTFEVSPWYGSFNGLRSDVNIESVLSYQLACAHFFNNPKIDSIYTADLFRDNLEGLVKYCADSNYPIFYNWNGIYKQYDLFSSRVLNNSYLSPFTHSDNVEIDPFLISSSFWLTLFGFHNSLRYGDYFTGAHPQMLAVGDIDAPVIDGSVNALDMTRKLQLTRLLNKVNITGPRMIDYLRAIFGGSVPEAPDDVPIRLSREVFDVSGFEVNNTGDAQLSSDDPNITTTNLRLDDSRFMFEVNIDTPCWLVFVQYFDAHRIYSRTMDRFSFHKTRYDDFIPDLQFVGDQDVKLGELDVTKSASTVPFAYNLRYMEYKQRYSYASGGFIRRLKSWAFVTDNNDGNPSEDHISPRYIRSSPSEFDRFYKSLTGYSLGSRYHFITFNTNVCAPYRQMVYAPEILA